MSACCLMQGRWTPEELQHHASLRDAAAQQLAAGQYLLVFKGICAPVLAIGSFGADLPVPAAACPPAQVATAGAQGSGLLQFRAGPSIFLFTLLMAAAGLPTFVPGIRCILIPSCMHVHMCSRS